MQRTRPPFRADHVGSLLRPPALKNARAQFGSGAMTAADLAALEDREIARIIAKQEAIGLSAVTDGEFRRSWWHLDFLWGLQGCERCALDKGIGFAGMDTRAEGVRVVGKIGFAGHPMLDHFMFVRDHARAMSKMTLPAPSALYGRVGRSAISAAAYPDNDAFFADLGKAYAEALRAFYDAGCRYLQLDDVFLVYLCDRSHREKLKARGDDPDRLAGVYADLINAAVAGLPPDMTVTMHLCRGNYRSTYMASGAYDGVADVLFNRARVHGYFMEYDTARAGGFEPLRLLPKGRVAVLGLVTTKTGTLERRDEIRRRLDAAAKFVDPDQLCLSPQCGFASTEEGNTLGEEEQWAKLAMIVDLAKEVWG
jgi:5-methyltetrahydropteroyltriglutamate--homocysteine methyltransferase